MKLRPLLFSLVMLIGHASYSQSTDKVQADHQVTLPEAHVGDLEIDTKLLDSYGRLPENIRQFYLDARAVFSGNADAAFTHPEIIGAARKHDILLAGGPMLGKLREDGVTIWLRPSTSAPLVIQVIPSAGGVEKTIVQESVVPGEVQKVVVDGLTPDTDYKYTVHANKQKLATGSFTTAPVADEKAIFTLAFGSCFHKIGLHNPNLINQLLTRQPGAMMLLGDIAVDDRENQMNMHRADYLLRDVAAPWRQLSANVPLYASWDDHDYFNNDLGGIPEGFTPADREAVREVWHQNWVNPENEHTGIYFNTRIGPVELIMLDTRSLRENERRGEYGSYLGVEQMNWLKETLKKSKAPFKVISGGTMWSDYITPGKDSWGTWDKAGREELFSFIEAKNISGVILISGDRHGARGFSIPRTSGFVFYEFQVASLGGVPGPDAMAKDTSQQLFGYHGTDVVAFGEFTFDTRGEQPLVTFRLIDEFGNLLEEYLIGYNQLMPARK